MPKFQKYFLLNTENAIGIYGTYEPEKEFKDKIICEVPSELHGEWAFDPMGEKQRTEFYKRLIQELKKIHDNDSVIYRKLEDAEFLC